MAEGEVVVEEVGVKVKNNEGEDNREMLNVKEGKKIFLQLVVAVVVEAAEVVQDQVVEEEVEEENTCLMKAASHH